MPEMTTTLYLIRHGETDGGNTKRYHGSIDIPLSDRGRQQIAEKAVLLMQHLAHGSAATYLNYLRDVHGITGSPEEPGTDARELSAVYCSTLSRAVQSAEDIAEPYNQQCHRSTDYLHAQRSLIDAGQ